MSQRLVLIRHRIDPSLWEELDRSTVAVACGHTALAEATEALLDRMAERRCLLVVWGAGEMSGPSLAAALISDVFAVEEGAHADFSDPGPHAMAGILWRIGRRAIPLLVTNRGAIDGGTMVEEGIADAVVPEDTDPMEWIRSWIGGRSLAALQSAARLVRGAGGDEVERAEFARLFATGIPQGGMKAFLKRRPAGFEDEWTVEMI
jgi:acetyl-CoA carboxylase alpha subunit